MTRTTQKLHWLGILALIGCGASRGYAANTVTMTLTTQNPNNVAYPTDIFAGLYVNPYVATINGVSGVPVICDDFLDHTSVGASWQATTLTGNNLSSSRMTQI